MYPIDASKRFKSLETKNYGAHTLAAWGQRLGNFKLAKPVDFAEFTEEMLTYCVQDVDSNVTLYKFLKQKNINDKAFQIELNFWNNMIDLEMSGFPFDVSYATSLYGQLSKEREQIRKELITLFPTRTIERLSEKTGKPLKPKVIEFNPGSRDHIAYWFREKYKWQPKEFTPSGKPEINADILEELDYPEAAELKRFFELDKVIGMIAEGKAAWLKLIGPDNRIHGRINTLGAASTRCTHNSPNLAQVPSPRKPFGKECRTMFCAPKGYKLVGVDLNAIELRCFAHYLAAYDNGDYSNAIEGGDIHWKNAVAAGFYPDDGKPYDEKDPKMKQARNNAKTFIYALIYGAGDPKLGAIVGGGKKEGTKIREKFYEAIPAIEQLTNEVKAAAEARGFIKLLHGAIIPVRKAFAALNTLLQGAGAVVLKEWTNETRRMADAAGYVYNKDWWFAANVHDEIQLVVKDSLAKDFAKLTEQAAFKAGETLGMRCPVRAEAKIGQNWYETH
jgi:DNA polymerase I-like protein with 3'-5' exonuclease and polymerase domains